MHCKRMKPGAFLLLILLCGCTSGVQVRHLSSDVCLIMPESTTKAEVISFLGQPEKKDHLDNGEEVWVYSKLNESFLAKFPVVGERFGSRNYEVVTVTFFGDQVRTCVYRQLRPEEYGEDNLSGN